MAARERVQALAAESASTADLVWTDHIQEQMAKRDINSDAVLGILRKGDIEGEPEEGSKPGDWKVKLTLKMGTGRVAGVVAAITRDGRLVLNYSRVGRSPMNTFRHRGKPEKEPYQYTMCGLDDIYLAGGYDRTETEYGNGVVIHHMDDLHQAIGAYLATSKKTLDGKEIRFLRHQMDLTQAQLGDILRVTDQTVARWEKSEVPIPGPEDLLLRVVYLGHLSKQVDIRALADALRASDAAPYDKLLFAPTKRGWEAVAA